MAALSGREAVLEGEVGVEHVGFQQCGHFRQFSLLDASDSCDVDAVVASGLRQSSSQVNSGAGGPGVEQSPQLVFLGLWAGHVGWSGHWCVWCLESGVKNFTLTNSTNCLSSLK